MTILTQDKVFAVRVRPHTKILCALIAIDILLIFAYVAGQIAVSAGILSDMPGRLNIEIDYAIAEKFNVFKWALAAMALAAAFVFSRKWAWAVLMACFILLGLDDSQSGHETFGTTAGLSVFEYLQVTSFFGLDQQVIGELIVLAGMGILVFGAIAIAWIRSNPDIRAKLIPFFIALIALSVCGVIFDAVHATLITPGTVGLLNTILGILEDGGEMIFISILCALSFGVLFEYLNLRHKL
ncbi:hypothetical protein [Parasulfitobacter algicola]|uniref:Uncharacterized protein n=1 Tax=Parasulfitobacter algicola TaxID=2614809 RepID=A0ABX2IRL4_9RHOB|nr:hypothetical protein [Sulfitobacter algicola]NSX54656.1 hypothetical protein [Sulfitobacter algicola]